MARFVKVSTLSIVQCHVETTDNWDSIITKVINYLDCAIKQVLPENPDLIVLPETCDCPSNLSNLQKKNYYLHRKNRILEFMCNISKTNKCNIAFASIRVTEHEKLYNSIQFINRLGNIDGIYDKNQLVIFENTEIGIEYGNSAHIITSDFGTVCGIICFDLNFEELLKRYKSIKPDLLIFSSMFHGSHLQQHWAYSCRCHMVTACSGLPSSIISPSGTIIASTTNYFNHSTSVINLDCAVLHIDDNWNKFIVAKQKYKTNITFSDSGFLGSIVMSCNHKIKTVQDIIKEFQMECLDDYMYRSTQHRLNNLRS